MQYFMKLDPWQNDFFDSESSTLFKPEGYKTDIISLIKSLDSEEIKSLLVDKDFLQEELGLKDGDIVDIIRNLNDEQVKLDMIEYYQLSKYEIAYILETISKERKVEIVFENRYKLGPSHIASLISTMDISQIEDIIKNHREFLKSNEIKPFRIVRMLDSEKQLEFISRIENMNCTLRREKGNICNIKKRYKAKA